MRRLVLASGSPRRAQILRALGLDPVVRPQDVDETPRAGEGPVELVLRLSRLKAHAALAGARPGDVVLAADTTVVVDGRELGKPADDEDARATLRLLSGRTHQVSTGVCALVAGEGGRARGEASFAETTDVTFHELDEAQVRAYVASGEPADKAGSYGIQGLGALLVSGISGDYLNVVGLPAARTVREVDALLAADGSDPDELLDRCLGGTHGN